MIWSTRLAAEGQVHADPIVDGAIALVGVDAANPGYLVALDLETGAERRRISVPFGVQKILDLERARIIAQGDGSLIALEPESWNRLWDRRRVPGPPASAPLANTGPDEVYWLESSFSIVAVDAMTGSERARREFGSRIVAGPAVGPDSLAVALADGSVHLLSESFIPTRTLEIGPDIEWLGLEESSVLAIRSSGAVAVVSRHDSREIVSVELDSRLTTPEPIVDGGRLVLGLESGMVVALDIETLEPIWTMDLDATPRSLTKDGPRILVGTREGLLVSVATP